MLSAEEAQRIMSAEEIIRLIISFLGGGMIAGVLNWIRSSQAERKSRHIELLSNELRNLYGPLFFFVSQNDAMFKLNSTFQSAYTAEYVNQEWSQDSHTQKAVHEDATKTLDIANRYIKFVKHNNQKIVEILTNNYEYLDQDDVETFQQFLVDHTRLNTEVDNEDRLETPFMIYQRVGDISFMRPEFIQRVRTKFYKKKRELDNLHR